jgi:hypothetical protein
MSGKIVLCLEAHDTGTGEAIEDVLTLDRDKLLAHDRDEWAEFYRWNSTVPDALMRQILAGNGGETTE